MRPFSHRRVWSLKASVHSWPCSNPVPVPAPVLEYVHLYLLEYTLPAWSTTVQLVPTGYTGICMDAIGLPGFPSMVSHALDASSLFHGIAILI